MALSLHSVLWVVARQPEKLSLKPLQFFGGTSPAHRERFRIHTRRPAGYNWVADRLIAWAHTDPDCVGVGLFDNDDGRSAIGRVNENRKAKDSRFCKTIILGKCAHLIDCAQAGFDVPHAIEELFPPTIWDHAEQQGWLELRQNLPGIYSFADPDETFTNHLSSRIDDPELRRYVSTRVAKAHKEEFARFVSGLEGEDAASAFEPLREPLRVILQKLGLGPPRKRRRRKVKLPAEDQKEE